MIRAAIVEDEAEHAEALKTFLESYGEKEKQEITVAVFSSGMDFVSDYNYNFDVVFMDIEMPFVNGMDCSLKLRELDENVLIVFVTATVQYAVRGYEVGALGYMVKPISYFPFKVMMDKVLSRIRHEHGNEICIQGRDFTRRISIRDLYYVEVMDHYLIYHTTAGDFRIIGKMSDVAAQLEGFAFFRCSNSHIVNLMYVREVSENQVTVGNDTIFISRRRKKEFLVAMNDFLKKGGL